MSYSAIVVGAGIAGLASAIALQRAGFAVVVLERSTYSRKAGQAIGIPGNASRILIDFGIDLEQARPCPWMGLDIIKNGKCILRQTNPQSKLGPSFFVHRADYHSALEDFATKSNGGIPVDIRYGHAVVSYDPLDGSVTLDSGKTLQADLIVAADGLRSNAIVSIADAERPAKFTGDQNIRFTVSTEAILKDPTTAPLLETSSPGMANLFIGPNAATQRVLRYPCRSGTLQNFSIFSSFDVATDSKEGPIESTNLDMALDLVRGTDESFARILRLAEADGMFRWKFADRDPLSSFIKSCTVLVGDACHPMMPNLGQGAAMAIEDAGVLGAVLEKLGSRDDISARLKLWQDLRSPRTGRAQLLSRATLGEHPWTNKHTLHQAEHFMGGEPVPVTMDGLLCYFIDGDPVKEAQEALKQHMSGA